AGVPRGAARQGAAAAVDVALAAVFDGVHAGAGEAGVVGAHVAGAVGGGGAAQPVEAGGAGAAAIEVGLAAVLDGVAAVAGGAAARLAERVHAVGALQAVL